MATHFPQSTRALTADKVRYARNASVLFTTMLLVGYGWFFFWQIPLFITSTEAQLTKEGAVAAFYPIYLFSHVRLGQSAQIEIEELKTHQIQTTHAQVITISPEKQGMILLWPNETTANPLYNADSTIHRVKIEIGYRTPSSLIQSSVQEIR